MNVQALAMKTERLKFAMLTVIHLSANHIANIENQTAIVLDQHVTIPDSSVVMALSSTSMEKAMSTSAWCLIPVYKSMPALSATAPQAELGTLLGFKHLESCSTLTPFHLRLLRLQHGTV
ncbi:hypothetical protein Gotur_001972 [Gossypium turneri]